MKNALEKKLKAALDLLPAQIANRQVRNHTPVRLILLSGVSARNNQIVGDFRDSETAELCGWFLLALDQADHPEYSGFSLVDDNSNSTYFSLQPQAT